MKSRIIVNSSLLLVAVALTLGGCKASKEDLVKRFNESGQKVTAYSTKYPQFAALYKARHAEQKKIFDGAKKDIKKLEAVNTSMELVIGPMDKYERRVKRIEKLYNDYNVRKNKGHKVRAARDKANKKLAQARQVLANAKPATVADYTKSMTEANGYLRQALDHLERLQRKGRKKGKKKRKKKRE